MPVSARARAYAQVRNSLAPLGPHLKRFGLLRRAVQRLDGRVLPQGKIRVPTSGGWPIWVNPRDQAVARALIATGEWQPAETQLIANALPRGGVAIDVGANIGYVTGVMAATVGAGGRVLAFEPDATNHELLQLTIEHNHWLHVDAHRAACGAEPGRLTLHRDPDNWGNHSLALDAELHGAGADEVDVVTLDDTAADLTRLDVFKIDVQGWELEVLRGAQSLRRFEPTVFTEFFPRGLRAAGTDPAHLWDELGTWGDISEILPDGTTRPVTLEAAVGDPDEPSRNVDLMIRPA